MTDLREQPGEDGPRLGKARRRLAFRAAAGLAAAACMAGAVAACEDTPAVSLPPAGTSLTAPAAPSSSQLLPGAAGAAMQAADTAYTSYFPVLKAAGNVPAQQARAMLAPLAAQPYLSRVLRQIAAYRARGERAWGQVAVHIMRTVVNGAAATVWDCQDASGAALASARTGAVIRGTAGRPRTFLVATLTRGGDGRWRLTALAHPDTSC